MSFSSSSVAQPEKCIDINVAVEESKENARANNNNMGLGFPQEVMSENTSLGSVVVPTGNTIMQRDPSEFYDIFTCRFCSKEFSTCQALGGHHNAHKKELQWEKKRKEMEEEFNFRLMISQYSQDALSNDNHLGIPFGPFKRICTGLYPSFNSGFADINMTVLDPHMTPPCFLTWNTFINSSSSGEFGPISSYNSYTSTLLWNPPSPPLPPSPPRDLYSQENVLNEEDLILKLGNDNIVEFDDDDYDVYAADGDYDADVDDDGDDDDDDDDDDYGAEAKTEEETSKSWGADLSL